MDKARKPYPQKGIDRIQATKLSNALQSHVLDGKEMSATQIRAAEILLKKVWPDQASTQHSGEMIHKVDVNAKSAEHITKAVRKGIAK